MRLLVADDHDLVRETIALFLKAEGVGDVMSVASLDEAIQATAETGAFDLVLLDYNMPGMDGLTGLVRMLRANCNRPVALLSGDASGQIALDALASGAAGFIPKTLDTASMIGAIRSMVAGETFLPTALIQVTEAKVVGNLTERETEVLRGIYNGKSNKEIARDLDIQEVTVKLHVKTLFRKLDARNRTQAAMIARDRHLF
jgi:DNA-binding NarL/FixJ family response regulator